MKRLPILLLLLAAMTAVLPRPAVSADGKWTPWQILEHDPAWLRQQGLQIPPEKLWSREGGGLLDATVRIEGCSGGFISPDGLLITNHHCAFGILQQHSTPDRDLITHGFLAHDRSEELPGSGTRIGVLHGFTDVTDKVLAAVPANVDDLGRFHAIERETQEEIAACEKQPGHRCQLEGFDGGVQYVLFDYLEFPDVRLVYAPPRAVGEYGGEVDNWSWPRHDGDFALLRVWGDPAGKPAPHADANVPFHPAHWFPVATNGVKPGSFVLVAGYPGQSYRSWIEPEARERAERYYPRRAAMFRAWIDLMEAASARDETARLALADRIKGLANREKNSRGQIAGFQRGHLLERKQEAEREILAWAAAHPEHADAVAAHRELSELVAKRQPTWERDFLLEQMRSGPKPLDLALTLVRWAGEKAKPDLEREPDYMERNRGRIAERLEIDQKRMHLATEEALLADLLGRFANLPEESRVPAVEAVLRDGRDPGAIRTAAASLLAHTRVTDLAERKEMFGESAEQLRARHDPLLDLAFGLDAELLAQKERDDRFKGTVSRLRPRWQRAVAAHAGAPVAPDANGTLRLSLAHVQGYAPRDAVRLEPQTRLAGVVEKHTGQEPFDAPDELLAAAANASASRWADAKLHDVPVDFLADADTTGGSSGSPVVNGKGQLVGVNFDRVWENVANDFGVDPATARNVSADVRYLLWLLETLDGDAATPLLDEMGVRAKAAR
jgi:hypothetical protein